MEPTQITPLQTAAPAVDMPHVGNVAAVEHPGSSSSPAPFLNADGTHNLAAVRANLASIYKELPPTVDPNLAAIIKK